MNEEKNPLTLHYFGFKGKGQPSLVASAYWGKELKWEKYTFDDWKNNKNDIKSHCAFGQLPVLNDGVNWISQSGAIIRYLGRKWGKQGNNKKDLTMSDCLIEESNDLVKIIIKAKFKGENTKQAWDEALGKLPKHWTNLEKIMTGTKFGSEVLVGDMALFAIINTIYDSDPDTLNNHPNLKEWYDGIAKNDNVKALLEDSVPLLKKPSLLEVGYWDIRGLGAPLRMICEYAEAKYNPVMYALTGKPGSWNGDSWFKDAKPGLLAKNSLTNLPYIVDGDKVISQSNACLKYLGRKFDLNGKDEVEVMKGEQCLCQIMDLRNDMMKVFYAPPYGAVGPESFDASADDLLTKGAIGHLQKMENWLNLNKTDYCASNSPTVPDFHLWELIDQLELFAKSRKKNSVLEKKPKLQQFYAKMKSLEKLSNYFKGPLYTLPVNNKIAHWK